MNQMQKDISENFGSLMRILLNTERKAFKLASVAIQTMPALRLNQICVLHNERGEPVGYAVWAFLSDEVAAELRRNPDRLLHHSEWNEGLNLWIVDFVAGPGYARPLATKLRTEILVRFDRVYGLRARADGSIRKTVDVKIFRASHPDGEPATRFRKQTARRPSAERPGRRPVAA